MQGAVHGFLLVRLMATECFTIKVFFFLKKWMTFFFWKDHSAPSLWKLVLWPVLL